MVCFPRSRNEPFEKQNSRGAAVTDSFGVERHVEERRTPYCRNLENSLNQYAYETITVKNALKNA